MKNTNTFMIEELREMILINFIGKVLGHNNMPSADKVIKMPCGNYMLRENVPDIFDRNIYPCRKTYHFRQKKRKSLRKIIAIGKSLYLGFLLRQFLLRMNLLMRMYLNFA